MTCSATWLPYSEALERKANPVNPATLSRPDLAWQQASDFGQD